MNFTYHDFDTDNDNTNYTLTISSDQNLYKIYCFSKADLIKTVCEYSYIKGNVIVDITRNKSEQISETEKKNPKKRLYSQTE